MYNLQVPDINQVMYILYVPGIEQEIDILYVPGLEHGMYILQVLGVEQEMYILQVHDNLIEQEMYILQVHDIEQEMHILQIPGIAQEINILHVPGIVEEMYIYPTWILRQWKTLNHSIYVSAYTGEQWKEFGSFSSFRVHEHIQGKENIAHKCRLIADVNHLDQLKQTHLCVDR